MEKSEQIKVWDGATRFFHWGLVVCTLGAWLTIEYGWIEAHQYFGISLLLLIVFRIGLGFWGSTSSRFLHFLTSPQTAIRYLISSIKLDSPKYTGHNPAGGWMVMFMLAILLFQAGSGLFANNDLGFTGPLADGISKVWSDTLTQWHALSFNIILAVIWLHLVAVFFYVIVKKEHLVSAMLTGNKPADQTQQETLKFIKPMIVILWFVIAALGVYWWLF